MKLISILAAAFAVAMHTCGYAQQYPSPTFNNITINGTLNSKSIPTGAFVGTTDTQILTNKTLTAPHIGNGALFDGSSSGITTLQPTATASGTLTLPAATDTLIGKATTDILTNKTFDTSGAGNVFRINGTAIAAVTGMGAAVLATSPTLVTPNIGVAAGTSLNLSGLTASSAIATDGSKNFVSVTNTGTGSNVLAASPTLSGTPLAPTAAVGTSTTQIATTAFVTSAVNVGGGFSTQGYLYGLTLSNSTVDASNAINTTIGTAASANASPTIMNLTAALGKTLSSNWTVGGTPAAPSGCLDTGTVSATATYHIFLIERPDTQVVDELCSLSATSPTMPANYTLSRRIGSILRTSSVIVPFLQRGDQFLKVTATTDYTSTSAVSNVLATFNVPTGISVQPILSSSNAVAAGSSFVYAGDGGNSTATTIISASGVGGSGGTLVGGVWTNTSAQIRLTVTVSVTLTTLNIATDGWIDQRGRAF